MYKKTIITVDSVLVKLKPEIIINFVFLSSQMPKIPNVFAKIAKYFMCVFLRKRDKLVKKSLILSKFGTDEFISMNSKIVQIFRGFSWGCSHKNL